MEVKLACEVRRDEKRQIKNEENFNIHLIGLCSQGVQWHAEVAVRRQTVSRMSVQRMTTL